MHHPQIADVVRLRRCGSEERITGFYFESSIPRGFGLGPLRTFVPCSPDHADMSVIATCGLASKRDARERLSRPWSLDWIGTIDWPFLDIEDARDAWASTLNDHERSDAITPMAYPDVFDALPPMSAHDRMALLAWREATSRRIARTPIARIDAKCRAVGTGQQPGAFPCLA